jgi:hypothetical protein
MVGGQQVPGTVQLQSGRRPRALARGLPALWHAALPGDDPADLPPYPYLEREPSWSRFRLDGFARPVKPPPPPAKA